ncbi:MAG: PAS domain S-box protein [Chlorobi bacterium]|nr:PAS domain S-box protein [Chlorobiota bacterium]
MKKKEQYDSLDFSRTGVWKYTLTAFFFGLFFPLFAWTFFLLSGNMPFSPENIIKLHNTRILMYLVDTVPFILALTAFLISGKFKNEQHNIYRQLLTKENLITEYSGYVKKIGNGEYKDIENLHFDDELGKSLAEMKDNLLSKSISEEKQKWISDGKNLTDEILRKHNEIKPLSYEILTALIEYINAVQGIFYVYDDEKQKLVSVSSYAYGRRKFLQNEYSLGEGLVGQASYEKAVIFRKNLPGNYLTVTSGILGEKKPESIIIMPLIGDEKIQGAVEFAFLKNTIPENTILLFEELSEIIGQNLFNIKANTTTKKLLQDSRKLTEELRKNEEELRRNAKQMEKTQKELEKTNIELAKKISEVEQGQKRLHALLENASEVITIYDEQGIVQYVSPSVKNILGFEPDEMIGVNRFERGDRILKDVFADLLKNPEKERTFEYRYTDKRNRRLWLETTGRNLLNNPAINGILFNTRDITERKEAETAKRLSSEMQALSENSPDMIIRMGLDGTFFYANPTTEKFIGISPKSLTGNNINNTDINDSVKQFILSLTNETEKELKEIQKETVFNINNEKRIVQFNAIPEFDEQNNLNTILFVVHDITERKQIELELENKNKNITESINYAQRIQSAIIPDFDIVKRYLPESFILYRPRDVVSGDLPWFYVTDEEIYIAAIDCTGHGVPGTLISFIAYFSLNSILNQNTKMTAAEILDELHIRVRQTLKQDSPDSKARDGMDIALVKINYNKNKLEFAGAHRPLFFLRGEKLSRYKGDRMSIGGKSVASRRGAKEEKFTNYEIDIAKKDKIFIFTDGLPDQIGGKDGRKYQAGRIRDIIIEKNNFSMKEYYDYFVRDFEQWKGNYKQIDDILFIGVEF